MSIELKKLTPELVGRPVRREALAGKIVGVNARTGYVKVEWANGTQSAIHAQDAFLELVDDAGAQPATKPAGKRVARGQVKDPGD